MTTPIEIPKNDVTELVKETLICTKEQFIEFMDQTHNEFIKLVKPEGWRYTLSNIVSITQADYENEDLNIKIEPDGVMISSYSHLLVTPDDKMYIKGAEFIRILMGATDLSTYGKDLTPENTQMLDILNWRIVATEEADGHMKMVYYYINVRDLLSRKLVAPWVDSFTDSN